MNEVMGLTRENSETIGFVLTSLLCSAIDLDELKEWCHHVIGQLEVGEPPSYLFDLAEHRGALAGIYKPLGFVPSWKHVDEDRSALHGIALRRGKTRYEWPVDRVAALAALAARPEIGARFRRTFPFITFLPQSPAQAPLVRGL